MTAKINYAGTRQGMLYISHKTKRPPDRGQNDTWWHCTCDCGETVPLSSYQLKRNRTDCGCVVPIIRKIPTKHKNPCKEELLFHPVLEKFLYSRQPEPQEGA